MSPSQSDAIREALQLVRRAARSDYLGFSKNADAAIDQATELLVEATRQFIPIAASTEPSAKFLPDANALDDEIEINDGLGI